MKRTVFYISDNTGITAQTLGRSLLSQFDHLNFKHIVIPYIDTNKKATDTVERIDQAYKKDRVQPLVFTTIVAPNVRNILSCCNGYMTDIFSSYLSPLEEQLQSKSSYTVGKPQSIAQDKVYDNRIDAVHYALDNDDGSRIHRYDEADIILIGVSRSGKTPCCIYLALQFGIHAANFPITEDDFDELRLPKPLEIYRRKLFGLTIDPERLSIIRTERKANSRYCSLRQCEMEVREVEALIRRFGIPSIDVTHFSIEEISAQILNISGIERMN